jgi:YidC/Oxa1 family membrane protein insertase
MLAIFSLAQPAQFGWLTVLAQPLYQALQFLHAHGVANWGWAIVIFTALFNCLTLAPRILAMQSGLKRMRLQPKAEAIKKRYVHLKFDDPKRAAMNTEILALYRSEGVSLYSGLWLPLLQMPLFVAYFRVLSGAAELHQAHWYWIADLASPDPLHILPAVILICMFLTQHITPTPGMDRNQRRIMTLVMPAVMGFALWHYAAGLALYWATGNLLNLLFQLAINQTCMGKEVQGIAGESPSF